MIQFLVIYTTFVTIGVMVGVLGTMVYLEIKDGR